MKSRLAKLRKFQELSSRSVKTVERLTLDAIECSAEMFSRQLAIAFELESGANAAGEGTQLVGNLASKAQ